MDEVYRSLLYTSSARKDRQKAADLILSHPDRIEPLLLHCFSGEKDISHRACWVMEFVSHSHLEWLLPELDLFLNGIRKLINESSIRSMAKVCELLAEKYAEEDGEFGFIIIYILCHDKITPWIDNRITN